MGSCWEATLIDPARDEGLVSWVESIVRDRLEYQRRDARDEEEDRGRKFLRLE